jgi:serine/threonine-protein kinase
MADVLLGRADGIEGFARHVVLKRIKAEHAKDQRFIQMFLDEARVAANLHHQNIVQVYDIGENHGEYFFAMEYIHGEDLRRVLSAVSKTNKHMPLGYVCAILAAAAAGLHHAHERKGADKRPLNIVHRDVSPSNILIGFDGSVKVVDFGIAKAAMRQVETHSGSLKGKVGYMSPEQCKGDDVDRRSDIYALGVLLYELSTTSRLFKGENDYLLMDAIVNGKVPLPRVRRPDLPNELSSIIMKALSVDPSRRYQTADEFRIALEQFALKAQVTSNTSALATFMHKLFGEKAEPWVDITGAIPEDARIDVDGPTEAAKVSSGHSWSSLGDVEQIAATAQEEAAAVPVVARGQSPRHRKSSRTSGMNLALGDTIPPPQSRMDPTPAVLKRPTRTSMNGWEAQMPPAPARNKKIVAAVLPLVAIAGVAGFMLLENHPTSQTSAAQQPTNTAAMATPPVVAPTPAAPTVQPIETPAPVAETPPAVEEPPAVVEAAPEPAKTVTVKKSERKTTHHAAAPAPAPVAAPVAPPAPPPAPVPAPQPQVAVQAPPPAPAPAPVPAVVEQPKVIEPQIQLLSNATVSAVASDNARQLGKCEGGATLHGDIAVSFQIDAAGKVVKSQLSSSIKNPKVAGCILKAVQTWRFPKPPSGKAKGVYTISYQ